MAGKVTVKLSGPVFDEARRKKMLDAGVKAGMEKLIPRIEATVKSKFLSAGVPSGPFIRSIKGEVRPQRVGIVRAMDDRRIRTWLEARTRKGVKLGKGAYGFQTGKRQANSLKKQGFFEDEIARRLNG